MAKNLKLVLLLDCYGELLTERQRDLAELYYNEDLSLSEIAEMRDITRQAVRDSLRHSEAILLETEQKLGMAARIGSMRRCLEEIRLQCAAGVPDPEKITELTDEGLRLL
jgi:hypothetical protein